MLKFFSKGSGPLNKIEEWRTNDHVENDSHTLKKVLSHLEEVPISAYFIFLKERHNHFHKKTLYCNNHSNFILVLVQICIIC